MALMSLSVKRHLGAEFPAAPPSPPSSPIFCPSRLLSGLHTPSSENQQLKKRRKQEHPVFLTDSQFVSDGVSESSADDAETTRVTENGMETVAVHSNSDDVEDVRDCSPKDSRRLRQNPVGVDERKDLESHVGIGFGEKPANPGNHAASVSNVPLMLLSQVASDVISHLSSSSSSSPLKSQPEKTAYLKQEEEFVRESRVPSDGELPPGEPAADGAAEVCPDCKKVFKRKIYLQRHIAREHWSLAKIFKCEKCAYETKHQSNLLVHRRTHTGERPYHCGACGQRYTQGHLLKAHIRSRHGADMRFYNMDKRTDGVRCRRLLGTKLISSGKEDRIRFLLQAAEAARLRPSSPSPSRPMFGAMMPPSLNQYMNVLSCLPNGLRPMLWSSLAGGLLGNSGGFPPAPLQNGMPSHAALLSSLATPLSLAGGKKSSGDFPSKASSASLLSSMLAVPSGVASSLQTVKSESFGGDDRVSSKSRRLSPDKSRMPDQFAVSVELPLMPEDLTTTRRTDTPSEIAAPAEKTSQCQGRDREIDSILKGFGICRLSTAKPLGQSGEQVSATDLTGHTTSQSRDSVMLLSGTDVNPLPDDSVGVFPSRNEKNHPNRWPTKPDGENVTMIWSDYEPNVRSEPFPESSLSRRTSLDVNDANSKPNHMTSTRWNLISSDRLLPGGSAAQSIVGDPAGHKSPSKSVAEESTLSPATDAGCSKTPPTGHSECPESGIASCKEACCPYLKKLKDLRRNVYRMLSVFTPYLGVANINDYEADSIDEFLHEVIYSKLDDAE